MMRIVYLSLARIPSSEANSVQTMNICNAFAENRHQVTLLIPAYRDIEFSQEAAHLFYKTKSFAIKRYSYPFTGIGRVLHLQFVLLQCVQKIKPDLVFMRNDLFFHLHDLYIKCPIIFEAHTLPKMNLRLFRLIKSKSLKKIIVVCKSLKKEMINRYYLPENLIQILHNGANVPPNDLSRFTWNTKQNFHVGYVGNLYQGKGMEIIYHLLQLCPDIHFHIIGGREPERIYWQQKTSKYNNISFYGFVPPSQVVKYHYSVDILLAPLQEKVLSANGRDIGKWSSPLKIFEYMAIGKPIIASDIAVIREILVHQKSALLCSIDNTKEWSKAIYMLRDQPAMRQQLAVYAQQLFFEKYTWRQRVKAILQNLEI